MSSQPAHKSSQHHAALYIPGLDGIRAIAFLVVFVAHSMPDKTLPGGFGVTIFFFLSGYLITTLLRAEGERSHAINLKHFYVRRVLRIFPPCYITVILVSLLAATGIVYNTESYKSLYAAFFYWSNYWNILGFGNLPAGMGVLWSLAVEEHYYLLFPLLFAWLVWRRSSRRFQGTLLLSLCAAALFWRYVRAVYFHSPWDNIYEGTDTRFDSILYGCLLAVTANPRFGDPIDWPRRHARLFAVGGVVLLIVTFAFRDPLFRETLRYSLQGIALAPIFFFVSLPEGSFLTRCLEWPLLRWLGQLSYTMYLIHHTLFHHFYRYYSPNLLLVAAILAATIAYAQAMRTLVELPIQKARARLRHQSRPGRVRLSLPNPSQAA